MREFLQIQAFVFCGFLGGSGGAALCMSTLGTWVLERHQADHRGEYVCGLFSLPYMFLGFVPGAVVGGLVWWRVQRWLFASPTSVT